ncbi:MAG: DNA-binding response regulator [Bacteroidetes bacterium 4572_128]|nr:MAG: DNA-binding response regulator [Bacteroidetes bacterium 4572_128]
MNCIIIDDDKLSRRIIEEFIAKTEGLKLIASYPSAVEALNVFNKKDEINLVFLDIEMPEMTGIEFLSSFKVLPKIIIMSSKDKYAIEAFEYDVIDYLLKPVSYARFYKAVSKANFRENEDNKEIFIKKSSTLIRLKYADILWIEALENYVIVNTFDNKHTIHFTMKSIATKLPANSFTRVHRSYIANTNKIAMIEDNIYDSKTIIFTTYRSNF